jgi:hypothetical protein
MRGPKPPSVELTDLERKGNYNDSSNAILRPSR